MVNVCAFVFENNIFGRVDLNKVFQTKLLSAGGETIIQVFLEKTIYY